MKQEEIYEKKHLENTKQEIQVALFEVEERLKRNQDDVDQEVKYMQEARYDMDHAEKISARQAVDYAVTFSKETASIQKKLNSLLASPYFARFDFQKDKSSNVQSVYIGIYNFSKEKQNSPLVYDWRAPISSLFYNHEMGPAQYEAPSGSISGLVSLKRQFRIKDGKMEFMIDSSVNIVDNILQEELSKNSDKAMKNIVATIQRKQNLIIRDEESPVLIIQGVAGSGKTSIALHRIAFLLYRFKDTLKSEDILIISPNQVFGEYISHILPELGEESVDEIQMEEIAMSILRAEYEFQSFFEQTNYLLESEDESLKERIKYKASLNFAKDIDNYVDALIKNIFVSKDLWIAGCFVPNWLFDEVFVNYAFYSKQECASEMTSVIKHKILNEYKYELKASEASFLKKAILNMHKGKDLLQTYKDLFKFINKEDLFTFHKKNILEYCDVFPLIYLKLKLERKSINNSKVRHLIIDEMQDYSPIQYLVISEIFRCNKTILGDVNQSVSPDSSSSLDFIANLFDKSRKMELNKSYRSTYEIMQFAQKFRYNQNLEIMERRGEEAQALLFKSKKEEERKIVELIKEFEKSAFNSLAIIFKTQKQADIFFSYLQSLKIKASILNSQSKSLSSGVIVCTVHMSKGLEFDQVIVPDFSEDNYYNESHKNLLYVACTRAMHLLFLTATKNKTKLSF